MLLWMIAPMVLFTMAGNILPAYVLPGIPALALLLASITPKQDHKLIAIASIVTPMLLVVAVFILQLGGQSDDKSDKALLAGLTSAPVFYWQERPFSAAFYSQGQAQKIERIEQLPLNTPCYLAGRARLLVPVVADRQLQCELVRERGKRALYQCQRFEVQP